MSALYFLEWVLIGLASLTLLTQVILPLVRGRPMFPAFRQHREPFVERLLFDLEEEARVQRLLDEAAHIYDESHKDKDKSNNSTEPPEAK
jgi:hypothetical protein